MTIAPLHFWDAAYPPSPQPAGEGMCFYAGGDTPHIWTLDQIELYDVQYRLPIWVRSNPQLANPFTDAAVFTNALLQRYFAPAHTLVALDSETSADPAYVSGFVTVMNDNGYPVIDYGSRSTVFGNQNPDGYYWAADWTGTPHPVPGAQGVQYRSLNAYDLSVMEPALPFWDLRPVQPPPLKETPAMQSGILDPGATWSLPLPAPTPSRITLFLDDLPGTAYPVTVRVAMRNGNGTTFDVQDITIADAQNRDVMLPSGCTAVSLVQQPGSTRNDVGYVIF